MSPTLQSPLDLVLHIGTGKTGTSSVQALLRRNPRALAAAGVLFPASPGRFRHVRFGMFITPDEDLVETRPYRKEGHASPDAFREAFLRELFAEIDRERPSRVLISDEALYGSPDEALRRLREFVDDHVRRLHLVCYLRRQDDHLVSRYQQVVKVGEVRKLAERVRAIDYSSTYDYAARLDTWSKLLDPDSFVVRRFEPGRFRDDSLYADFIHATGLDLDVDELKQVPRQNDSLDAESVEFLRLLNLHRVTHEGAQPGQINNRPLVRRLAKHCCGPTLTLPEETLDSFMAQWQRSNVEVARRFFGGDEPLFRTPRRTRGTTTVQRLDPARLDHFFDVTELPGELHRPMRQLAREAADRP